nr:hypothetical protein BaRGS_030269 [Batillaria attramentaria]
MAARWQRAAITVNMHCSCLSAALPLLSLVLLTTSFTRASVPEPKVSSGEVAASDGEFGQFSADPELMKRLSNFVRRPGNFVRIGRAFDQDGLSDVYPDIDNDLDTDKRASRFVRIGKASRYPFSRFVRIGRGGPDDKRMSSFVRIGKSDGSFDNDEDNTSKRASSFVRIGKIPSSAFVRIGREPGRAYSGEAGDFGTFDRIARMGQSSFVRIGKRAAEQVAEDSHAKAQDSGAPSDH